MSTGAWMMLLTLSFVLCACTTKPISRQSETDRKSGATGAERTPNAGSSGAQSPNPASEKSGSKGMSDLDQIAREAEQEGTGKPQKSVEPILLPIGTTFYIHLENEVGSKVSKSGDDFRGTLAAPIAVENSVVIPAGASVSGKVVQAKPAGRFKGGAILALELRSIVANGNKLLMHTQMVTTESKGKGKRTTGMIAGGGAGGAVIGGVAGGGKGAAIGAAVGATAGVTAAALTGKRDITLPAEAVVAFRLSDPLELKRSVTAKARP